jgi:hypothetical protein
MSPELEEKLEELFCAYAQDEGVSKLINLEPEELNALWADEIAGAGGSRSLEFKLAFEYWRQRKYIIEDYGGSDE